MPRLWVGGAEAEIDTRSNYFKRKKGRTTHCIHGVFIINSSFTKFVNIFSFFKPIMKRVFYPLMSFSTIFKLYQVTNAFLNSNIKLQRDIWLVEINKSINSPISQRTSTCLFWCCFFKVQCIASPFTAFFLLVKNKDTILPLRHYSSMSNNRQFAVRNFCCGILTCIYDY